MSADSNGFFNGTFGMAGDEVFGLFMCYASDTDPQCQDCLDRAPGGIMHSFKNRTSSLVGPEKTETSDLTGLLSALDRPTIEPWKTGRTAVQPPVLSIKPLTGLTGSIE
jgi:hypothetical protein